VHISLLIRCNSRGGSSRSTVSIPYSGMISSVNRASGPTRSWIYRIYNPRLIGAIIMNLSAISFTSCICLIKQVRKFFETYVYSTLSINSNWKDNRFHYCSPYSELGRAITLPNNYSSASGSNLRPSAVNFKSLILV